MAKDHNSWSSIILTLAQLTAKADGPLDPLIEAINKLIVQLDDRTVEVNAAYDQTTLEHNNEIKRLNNEIDIAVEDISRTEIYLNDILYNMKATLEEEIAQLHQNIENNKKTIEEETNTRALMHQEYEGRVQEHLDALAAV